ncbi:MAG: 3-hydroxyacyl-CoA dehydrogenase family protein [Actinophytocola sp.]|uniref:3-hydroxyacyl-CoA dehydrogenase family protein n=1 Tax=Actinophytocola sp. TaxID=1872138 RepID=UPI003C76535A
MSEPTARATIGVAGAGVMGSEVAQVFATAGHRTVLVDIGKRALDGARETIRTNLRFARLHGGPSADPAEVLANIEFATGYDGFAEVDFVVENVTEDWRTKEAVYREIDAVCPARTVFAVNTSVIPITQVGGITGRADRVIGTHFMNPVTRKPTVEVIRGHHTSDETVATTRDTLAGIGKDCVVVRDSPGFVTNRVLMLTVNEAAFVVHEGVAPAEHVDQLFKKCFGHPMGPLETADLIGLDTILLSIQGLYEQFADTKYRPCPLLRRMVDAGLLGRKSGAGFYQYPTKA